MNQAVSKFFYAFYFYIGVFQLIFTAVAVETAYGLKSEFFGGLHIGISVAYERKVTVIVLLYMLKYFILRSKAVILGTVKSRKKSVQSESPYMRQHIASFTAA